MPGNDFIPTAPREVIGDDGDLRQMRDALRAGKHVVLAQDGKVYVSADATTPMTAAQEDYIESQMGKVVELARQGYGVSVHPDGTIAAERADHHAKVLIDPDPGLSEQQRLLLEQGISEGAQVRVHADGMVEYFRAYDSPPPPPGQPAAVRAAVDAEISSGRLAQAMQNGESLSINHDGSVDYRTIAAGPGAIEFPEDVQWGHPPLTTADQLDAEADGLELGAGAARQNQYIDAETSVETASAARNAALRQQAAAQAQATAADAQAAERGQAAQQLLAQQAQLTVDIQTASAAGDTVRAEELSEQMRQVMIDQRIAQRDASDASAAAQQARDEVARQAAVAAAQGADIDASTQRGQELEDVFDSQENQARVYHQAADEMREAERLDAAYADLSARGVDGAERVRDAAAQHRAQAEALRAQAEAFDNQPAPADATPPAPAGEAPLPHQLPVNPGVFGAADPPGADAEDPDAGGEVVADAEDPDAGGEVVASVDVAADSSGDPTDDWATGDVEIEMPPMDVNDDTSFTGADTSFAGDTPDLDVDPLEFEA